MKDCGFKCVDLVKGECQQGGGECIREDCPEWKNCDNCRKYEECEL